MSETGEAPATHCRDCGQRLHQQQEKALGEPRDRAWQMVWADDEGQWGCPRTGDEHVPALTFESLVNVPKRFLDEVVIALDAATVIGMRSCREGDGLHYANHDRLIREARELGSTF
jgi:hypothetical protein